MLKKALIELKKKALQHNIAITEKKKILEVAKSNDKRLSQLKGLLIEEQSIANEYAFMRNVESLEDLKQKIMTCGFWADAWAINKLEELLGIKVIILSSQAYLQQQFGKVIQCPAKRDIEVRPKHYVIVEHTGNHYKLITYNDISLFNFGDIPDSLKQKILETCMTGTEGSFHEIEEFRKYANIV